MKLTCKLSEYYKQKYKSTKWWKFAKRGMYRDLWSFSLLSENKTE
jgi:hypothetical protein